MDKVGVVHEREACDGQGALSYESPVMVSVPCFFEFLDDDGAYGEPSRWTRAVAL